jgi:hypothetical protein
MTLWNKFQMVFGEIINDIQEYKQILDYSIVFNKNLLFYSYIGFPFDLFIDEIIKRKFNITQIYRKELLWNKTIIYNENQYFLEIDLDNLEGLAFGPKLSDGSQTLLLVSDDNFSDLQITQFLLFKVKIA